MLAVHPKETSDEVVDENGGNLLSQVAPNTENVALNVSDVNTGEGDVLKEESNLKADKNISKEKEGPPGLNEYSYLETGGFSSEIYKIEIKNLPKFYGISELKKLLTNKLQLTPGKIKPPQRRSNYLYVCFPGEEQRTAAITALNGYVWKGSTLKAHVADPAPDPLVRKRKQEYNAEGGNKKPKEEDLRTPEVRLKDNTIPLWDTPYEKQLEIKEKAMHDILLKLGHELWKVHPGLRGYIENKRSLHGGLPCELKKPLGQGRSCNGYRNKCEFTIGSGGDSSEPIVGFRLGRYVAGCNAVGSVQELAHIPEDMKKAVALLEEFVRSSQLAAYNPEDHSGYWRQLLARQSTKTNNIMMVIGLNPQDMTEEKIIEFKKSLLEHLTGERGKQCNITSIYLHKFLKKRPGDTPSSAEHLWGDTHIQDSILGYTFRISPEAFFQINTSAAEVLYDAAISLAAPGPESTVVDICCGTGTIGLCFAKHCKQVLGLDCVREAVADARANAEANGITNADFFVGRAEEILTSVVHRASSTDVIAIIDPPRAGLHMNAISQLRRMDQINKLVYISCDPSAALNNFVALGKAPSKTLRGAPFLASRAVAVDMFPHTKHCELAILFERTPWEEYSKFDPKINDAAKVPETTTPTDDQSKADGDPVAVVQT